MTTLHNKHSFDYSIHYIVTACEIDWR